MPVMLSYIGPLTDYNEIEEKITKIEPAEATPANEDNIEEGGTPRPEMQLSLDPEIPEITKEVEMTILVP